jgi:hypothetical protein
VSACQPRSVTSAPDIWHSLQKMPVYIRVVLTYLVMPA